MSSVNSNNNNNNNNSNEGPGIVDKATYKIAETYQDAMKNVNDLVGNPESKGYHEQQADQIRAVEGMQDKKERVSDNVTHTYHNAMKNVNDVLGNEEAKRYHTEEGMKYQAKEDTRAASDRAAELKGKANAAKDTVVEIVKEGWEATKQKTKEMLGTDDKATTNVTTNDDRDFTTKAKGVYHDTVGALSGMVGADDNQQYHENEASKYKHPADKAQDHRVEAESSWDKAKDNSSAGWDKTKEGIAGGASALHDKGTTNHPRYDINKLHAESGWEQTKEGFKDVGNAAKEKTMEAGDKTKDLMGINDGKITEEREKENARIFNNQQRTF
jgi:hypothetical protein